MKMHADVLAAVFATRLWAVVWIMGVMVVTMRRGRAMAAKCRIEAPPPPDFAMTDLFPNSRFEAAFSGVGGSGNPPSLSADHLEVSLTLDASSGAGFKSQRTYLHGFFNAAIKLPNNENTAGVITTFYASNADIYPNKHDEIDFEFLGRIPGEEYILQTNIYVNNSVKTGREQRIRLWFDPTADYHDYSILWTSDHIVLYVDDTPVREFVNVDQFPKKPMSIYGTIWDGSDWATDGGRYKANYTYAPFVAKYANLILNGCVVKQDSIPNPPLDCAHEFTQKVHRKMTRHQKKVMNWVQEHYSTYDYCTDNQRYPNSLPECARSLEEKIKFCNDREL